jgi:BirA family transcriptional regulator, biotin operon repressor / biotin---[acetyl-CoA-carboxylase] ligase
MAELIQDTVPVTGTPDVYDLALLDTALAGTPYSGRVRLFPTIDSTNQLAMAEGAAGAEHGTVLVADEQTAGRGRAAHTWHSEPGTGRYVSILLRPRLAPAEALWISLAAGIAAHAAVQHVSGVEADIRWPNDLLLGPRKFGGILTELNAEATRVRFVVIGIGINVNHTALPAELAGVATSLRIATGRTWSRQKLLIELLRGIDSEIQALAGGGGDPAARREAQANLIARFEQRSTWARGRRVRVEEEGGYTGVTDGLDERGFLRVLTGQGLRTVMSGGVRDFDSTQEG